ncbi:hypothetical protein HWD03_gp126 [Alteromonas phage vB_AmeM_PT11-V22]|uniref:Uncharacterized protein n=1 Tax=Alteromonas phage vB_AmeM_PT11-V22 TaxID=2704031 RepID=A0A6C0R1Z7_9CAUD|nr:hypothetical protein HWD03_gp126 [Alteromonas phage vB_AmeM_PT11-V22]QHZ59857.1 hypothetical protein [Alteromonas phage vB_AmeM_PT11-V22]
MTKYEVWCKSLYTQDKFVEEYDSLEDAEYKVVTLENQFSLDPYETFIIKEVIE